MFVRVEPVSVGMRTSRRRTESAFAVLSAVERAVCSLDKFTREAAEAFCAFTPVQIILTTFAVIHAKEGLELPVDFAFEANLRGSVLTESPVVVRSLTNTIISFCRETIAPIDHGLPVGVEAATAVKTSEVSAIITLGIAKFATPAFLALTVLKVGLSGGVKPIRVSVRGRRRGAKAARAMLSTVLRAVNSFHELA